MAIKEFIFPRQLVTPSCAPTHIEDQLRECEGRYGRALETFFSTSMPGQPNNEAYDELRRIGLERELLLRKQRT